MCALVELRWNTPKTPSRFWMPARQTNASPTDGRVCCVSARASLRVATQCQSIRVRATQSATRTPLRRCLAIVPMANASPRRSIVSIPSGPHSRSLNIVWLVAIRTHRVSPTTTPLSRIRSVLPARLTPPPLPAAPVLSESHLHCIDPTVQNGVGAVTMHRCSKYLSLCVVQQHPKVTHRLQDTPAAPPPSSSVCSRCGTPTVTDRRDTVA